MKKLWFLWAAVIASIIQSWDVSARTYNETCTNNDLKWISSSKCLDIWMQQIAINSAIEWLLQLDDEFNNTSEILNEDNVIHRLKSLEEDFSKIYQEWVSSEESEILSRLLIFIEDLKQDLEWGEKLFHIDERINPSISQKEYILYRIAQEINPKFTWGTTMDELKKEFNKKNVSLYDFYFNENDNNWYNVNNELWLIEKYPQLASIIPDKYEKHFKKNDHKISNIITYLKEINNISKLKNIIIDAIKKWDNKMYVNYSFNWSDKKIEEAKTQIISTHETQWVYYIEDYLKYLDNPKKTVSQDYSISRILLFMDNNNITDLQYDLWTNTLTKNINIDFTTRKNSVIILRFDSPELDYFRKKMSTEWQSLLQNNLKYFVFFPNPIVNSPTPSEPKSIWDVNWLSIWWWIFIIDSSREEEEDMISTMSHELEHGQHARLFDFWTLREETLAFYKSLLELKKQYSEKSVWNKYESYYSKYMRQKNAKEKLDLKTEYVKLLLDRSDLLMHNSLFNIFDNVYPAWQLLAGNFLRWMVKYDELKKSFYDWIISREITREFNVARNIALISLDPSTSLAQKGTDLFEIMKSYSSTDLEKNNSLSALSYLFPEKFLNINTEELFEITGWDISWDGITNVYKWVINWNITLKWSWHITWDFWWIFDITVEWNVYDFSKTTSNGDSDIWWQSNITWNAIKGNHNWTWKNTWGLKTKIWWKVFNFTTPDISSNDLKSQLSKMSDDDKYKYLMELLNWVFSDYYIVETISDDNWDLQQFIVILDKLNNTIDIVQYELQEMYKFNSKYNTEKNLVLINKLKKLYYSTRDLWIAFKYRIWTYDFENDFKILIESTSSMIETEEKNNLYEKLNSIIGKYNTTSNQAERLSLKAELNSILNLLKRDFYKVVDVNIQIWVYIKILEKNKSEWVRELRKNYAYMIDKSYYIWNSFAQTYDQM